MVIISYQTVRVKQAHYIRSCDGSSLFLTIKENKPLSFACLVMKKNLPIPIFPQILSPPLSVIQSGEIILSQVSVDHSYNDFVSLSVLLIVMYYTV